MTALAPVALELLKGKNNKEQVDLILEPLQVMINLAVLGFCPIGTKINILILIYFTWIIKKSIIKF